MQIPLLLITHKKNSDLVSFYAKQMKKHKWYECFTLTIPNFIQLSEVGTVLPNYVDNVDDHADFAIYLLDFINEFEKIHPTFTHIALSADDFIPTKCLTQRLINFIKTAGFKGEKYVLLNQRPCNLLERTRDYIYLLLFNNLLNKFPRNARYKSSLNIAIWNLEHLKNLLKLRNYDSIWSFEMCNDKQDDHSFLVGHNIHTHNFLEKGEYNFKMYKWGVEHGFLEMTKRNKRRSNLQNLVRHNLGLLKSWIFGPMY